MIQWGKDKVAEAMARRNWKALPPEFERDAVKFAYRLIKPHFSVHDGKDIRARIKASRAITFEELQAALS